MLYLYLVFFLCTRRQLSARTSPPADFSPGISNPQSLTNGEQVSKESDLLWDYSQTCVLYQVPELPSFSEW